MPARGLLLDVDNTLVDTSRAMSTTLRHLARQLWPWCSVDAQVGFAGHFVSDRGGHLRAYTEGRGTFAQMRAARLAEAAAAYGLAVGNGTYAAFESGYDERFPRELNLYDDVRPLLDWASASGVPVGLLTNSGDRATDLKLAAVGLAGRVPVVVTRETVGVGKPDPRPFRHACGLLGLPPGEVLHVGDSWSEDYEGARAAGLQAAMLVRPGGWLMGSELPRTVASLAEVPELMEGSGAVPPVAEAGSGA